MVGKKAIFALMIPILAGCSVAEEDDRQSAQELDVFERRNVAPDPAGNAQAPRKAEHAYARIALNCINKQYRHASGVLWLL